MRFRFRYKAAAYNLSAHRHKVLSQIKALEQSLNPFYKYVTAFYLRFYAAMLRWLICYHKSTSRWKYLAFALYLPIALVSMFLTVSYSFLVVGIIIVCTVAYRLWNVLQFVSSYKSLTLLSRLAVGVLTWFIVFVVSLVLGVFYASFIVWNHPEWYGKIILEPLVLIGSVYFCSMLVLVYKQLKKESGSFKEFLSKLEKEDEERESLVATAKTPRFIKWIYRPYNMMLACFFIGSTLINMLGSALTILRLRFPYNLFLENGLNPKSAAIVSSYRFLIKQTIDVIPLSVIEMFVDYGGNIKTIKPWGQLLQIGVQAVLIIIILVFVLGLVSYLRYWKCRVNHSFQASDEVTKN